jgi:predicted amidohydrolase YtcJ
LILDDLSEVSVKVRTILLALVVAIAAIDCTHQNRYEGPPADLVVKNAKILTIDKEQPRAQALAMRGEFIIGVGSNQYIDQFVEEGETQVIDARERLMVPGFNDAHNHFGPVDIDYIDLRYIADPGIITERVREKISRARSGELIRGGRWDHELFPDANWPTKELLDPVSPDNPVVLSRVDGHSVLVNSYVIRRSGIDRNTIPPPGGEIVRDPQTGEPTGIFKEAATRLLDTRGAEIQRTAEEEEARRLDSWRRAFEMAARLGVTSLQVLGSDPEVFERLRDQGMLTLRVTVSGRLEEDATDLKEYVELNERYPRSNDWIRFGYLKGFIDGTLSSTTALLFEPFTDEPDKSGLPQMPYAELERRVLAADKLGFQVGIHAIGDKANHWVLNAYQKAQEVNGTSNMRHRIEHASILRPSDIPRFAQLGVIASGQAVFVSTDNLYAEKRLGTERSRGVYAWRRFLNEGAPVAFGTDYPVEPLDPREGLYAAVTRKSRKGLPESGWYPDQNLTLEETIELYTLGSAYAEFTEDRKGKLKEGYLADAVIFDRDLLNVPAAEILEAAVDYTIVGGRLVYERK